MIKEIIINKVEGEPLRWGQLQAGHSYKVVEAPAEGGWLGAYILIQNVNTTNGKIELYAAFGPSLPDKFKISYLSSISNVGFKEVNLSLSIEEIV